jgi:hypothetical protein
LRRRELGEYFKYAASTAAEVKCERPASGRAGGLPAFIVSGVSRGPPERVLVTGLKSRPNKMEFNLCCLEVWIPVLKSRVDRTRGKRSCLQGVGVLGGVAATTGDAFGGMATLGLFEEGGEDAGEGDEERDAEEGDGGHAPEGRVAGRARLLGDVGEGQAEGEEGEASDGGGEDVEVASHKGLR